MNPETGRFVSMDTYEGNIFDPVSLHKYLYANCNPVNSIDPTGNFTFSLLGLTISISIQSVLRSMAYGLVFGAVFGGVDAALRGDDVFEGAISGGLIGMVLGPFVQIRFVQAALIPFGLAGVADAVEQGNAPLAAFRSIMVLYGLKSFINTGRPMPGGPKPGSGGRLGSANTRQQNFDIANYLSKRGWKITGGGGGALPEEYLPGPGGGRSGSNWVDITATKNGITLRINTVDTISNGITPTAREAAAAASIVQKNPGDILILIPKGSGLGFLDLFY